MKHILRRVFNNRHRGQTLVIVYLDENPVVFHVAHRDEQGDTWGPPAHEIDNQDEPGMLTVTLEGVEQ